MESKSLRLITLSAILSFFTLSCKSQDVRDMFVTEEPEAKKYDVPDLGKSIRYHFPKEVDSVLVKVINESRFEQYFITLNNYSDSISILLYGVRNSKSDTLNQVSRLLLSTNRHIKYSEVNVPIVFSVDFELAFPKFVFTHYIFKTTMYRGVDY